MENLETPRPKPSLDDRARAPREHDAGVRAMFDRIAPRYDLLNRIVSGGLDQRWRRRAIAELARAQRGPRLDLCAGTLDLSAMLVEASPSERVVAVDITEAMMERGRSKAPTVETVVADACQLPFEDATFGAAVCGFGVRNVSSPESFAHEALRVLAPRGMLVVLEAFRPARALPALLHRTYMRRAFPALGAIATRDRTAYDYFVASVGAFLTRRELEELLVKVGFCAVRGYDLTFGMAGVVIAEKRPA